MSCPNQRAGPKKDTGKTLPPAAARPEAASTCPQAAAQRTATDRRGGPPLRIHARQAASSPLSSSLLILSSLLADASALPKRQREICSGEIHLQMYVLGSSVFV
jgi:hypothetical protein